jgi:hypothetical protein
MHAGEAVRCRRRAAPRAHATGGAAMDLPRLPRSFRFVTAQEETVARQVFGSTVPYRRVLISDGAGVKDRPFTVPTSMPVPGYSPMVIPLPGKYVIHAGPLFRGMSDSEEGKKTLVHELTHVWQGEHDTWSWTYVIFSLKDQALIDDAYAYDKQHLLPWEFYGTEQQAQIVEDWFGDGMHIFDPIARVGDKRYYYIKKYIRGEDVGFDWLWDPIEPLERATLKVPPAYPSAATVAEKALAILEKPVGASDRKAIAERIARLADLFGAPGPADARELLARLQRRDSKDKLAQAFHYRLATATREKLLQLLKKPRRGR